MGVREGGRAVVVEVLAQQRLDGWVLLVAQGQECLTHHVDRDRLRRRELLVLLVVAIGGRLVDRLRHRPLAFDLVGLDCDLALNRHDQNGAVPLARDQVLVVGDALVGINPAGVDDMDCGSGRQDGAYGVGALLAHQLVQLLGAVTIRQSLDLPLAVGLADGLDHQRPVGMPHGARLELALADIEVGDQEADFRIGDVLDDHWVVTGGALLARFALRAFLQRQARTRAGHETL